MRPGVWSQLTDSGFKSQCGFWLGLSSGPWELSSECAVSRSVIYCSFASFENIFQMNIHIFIWNEYMHILYVYVCVYIYIYIYIGYMHILSLSLSLSLSLYIYIYGICSMILILDNPNSYGIALQKELNKLDFLQ